MTADKEIHDDFDEANRKLDAALEDEKAMSNAAKAVFTELTKNHGPIVDPIVWSVAFNAGWRARNEHH